MKPVVRKLEAALLAFAVMLALLLQNGVTDQKSYSDKDFSHHSDFNLHTVLVLGE